MNLVAGLPVYQAAATLPQVLAALRSQVPPPDEFLVVDDGSTDSIVAAAGDVRIVRQPENLGRGATRDRIMRETQSPLVLMCDSTLAAAPGFLAGALPWFDDPRVGAVFARIAQAPPRTCADRWRGRHLFKTDAPPIPNRQASLSTALCVLRRTAVEEAGGFDPRLRRDEDTDLGRRLLAAGWQVVADPALHGRCLTRDSIPALLRRYARWNSPDGLSGRAWFRQLSYTVKVMIPADLRAGDPLAAGLSLAALFFQARRR
jgi:GT2 family glycosyltransferase